MLWGEPVEITGLAPFGDGHSGFTYLIELRAMRWTGELVLRLSPPGARIAGPADVGRQGRIMAALHGLGLPAPRVLVADSAGAIGGRSCAAMVRVPGVEWRSALVRHGNGPVAELAVRLLHEIGRHPSAEVGMPNEQVTSIIDDLGRWRSLADRAPESLLGPIHRLYAALVAKVPAQGPPRLVHGDFHYGNLLFDESVARLTAVLDWEIATISDQRLDLGCLALASFRRRYSDPNPTGGPDVSVDDLASWYGSPSAEAGWFTAAAGLKYAAILGHNLMQHRRGRRVDHVYEQLWETMHELPTDVMALLD